MVSGSCYLVEVEDCNSFKNIKNNFSYGCCVLVGFPARKSLEVKGEWIYLSLQLGMAWTGLKILDSELLYIQLISILHLIMEVHALRLDQLLVDPKGNMIT